MLLSMLPAICFADHLDTSLERCKDKRESIEKILVEEGVSKDYFFLALAESGCRGQAKSNKGAVGLWQLSKPTAINYGLTVNSHVDERLDLEKSTRAAAKYIKHLNKSFSEFRWVIAAYNAGGSNLRRKVNYDLGKFSRVRDVSRESYNLAITVERWRNEERKRTNRTSGTE